MEEKNGRERRYKIKIAESQIDSLCPNLQTSWHTNHINVNFPPINEDTCFQEKLILEFND